MTTTGWSYNTSWLLGRILKTIADSKEKGYTFNLPLPIDIVEEEGTCTVQKKGWFTNKLVNQKVDAKQYILVFDRDLTEEELIRWQIFKIGFFARNSLNRRVDD